MNDSRLKFLVIRRDNIGDLVCTTPLFSALRAHFPFAEICALVNSYNLAALENNPDIDSIYAYTKAKHRPKGKSVASVYWERALLLIKLRKKHFDYIILVAPPQTAPRVLKMVRIIQPKKVIGYINAGKRNIPGIDYPVPYTPRSESHEVEDVFDLLSPLGIAPPPPTLRVFPDPAMVEKIRPLLGRSGKQLLIGIHISSRKPSQRWPAKNFIKLINTLSAQFMGVAFVLFWSPGNEWNPLHPGDDHKASEIMEALDKLPVTAYPTHRLQELIAGLSLCDAIICSDGGAMHLAAGLGKPILCFFGKSESSHWHPWGVPYVLLQPPSHEVSDISVDDALEGFAELRQKASLVSD